MIAEGTAIGTEGVVDAVRLEGASSSEWIGRRFKIVWIRAQLAEIFCMDGEREEQQEEENPHGEPPRGEQPWGQRTPCLEFSASGQALREQ